jgi:tripartite-type tricarboxylate transporter receptor subunit TctC
MITRRDLLITFSAMAALAPDTLFARGSYPDRPIRIVVPFPPGTNSEIAARVVADRLAARFRQPVIVENRPGGAGGTVGAASVAQAEADGYTLLVSAPGPLVTAGALYKNLGYDPSTSFAPIAMLFNSPQLLAVSKTLQAASIHDVVAHARRNPGKVNFASPGYGTQPHLLGELLKLLAKIEITHLPYRGPAAAVTDLLSGQVQFYFESSPTILPLAQDGKLTVVAVAGEQRISALPDVPTTAESGFPDLIGGFWCGVLAPAGTPQPIIEQLNVAIGEVMQSADMRDTLAKLGAQPRAGKPEDFAQFLAAERSKWSSVIRDAGIRIDGGSR